MIWKNSSSRDVPLQTLPQSQPGNFGTSRVPRGLEIKIAVPNGPQQRPGYAKRVPSSIWLGNSVNSAKMRWFWRSLRAGSSGANAFPSDQGHLNHKPSASPAIGLTYAAIYSPSLDWCLVFILYDFVLTVPEKTATKNSPLRAAARTFWTESNENLAF